MTLHSTIEAAELAGVTFRQIDWWTRTGTITPTVPSPGAGHPRRWSDAEVDALAILGRVTAAIRPDGVHEVLVAVVNAAKAHAGYGDVWVDIGDGLSLVIERPETPAVTS